MRLLTRLERLDRLESWLKSEDTLILRDAAEELGVSLRTIHRDLDLLRERGVPIESERGRGGGVRVSSQWGLGRIALTRHEALDLLLGLAISDIMHGALQMAHKDAIRRKVLASFSSDDQRLIRAMRSRIRIGGLISSSVYQDLAMTNQIVSDGIKEAFAFHRCLDIRYRDQNDKITDRKIEPHFLILNPPAWYVVGWDRLRQANRTFRCDRMITASPAVESFSPKPWASFSTAMEGNPTREI